MSDPNTITGGAPAAVAPVEVPAAAAPVAVADAPLVSSEPIAVEPAVVTVEAAATEPVVAAEPVEPAKAADARAEPAVEPVKAEEPAGDKPAVDPNAEPVAEAPKYDLKTADDFKIDPAKLTGYTDILAKHNIAPEAAQEIFDLYQTEAKSFLASTAQQQQEVWAKTNADWVKEGKKLFGNHYDTTINDARRAISDLFPEKKERTQIWDAFAITGAGNHPMVIRAFARAARRMNESSTKVTSSPATGRGGPAWDRRYGGQKS
jgi:hypothetical protein